MNISSVISMTRSYSLLPGSAIEGSDIVCIQKGLSALHIAAKYGNAEMVRLLLERNVDVNSPGKHHLTPLHVAAHYKHPNVAALLLDNQADPHRVAKVNNMLQYSHLGDTFGRSYHLCFIRLTLSVCTVCQFLL